MEQLHKFYIGQAVVSIKSHSLGLHKKGQKFIVTGIQKKCCTWTISIGVMNDVTYSNCSRCGAIYERGTKEVYFNAGSFAPIEEQEFKQVTFEKILEEIPVGAN